MVTILISVKLATPGLLKRKLFLKKGHDIKIPDSDVTNKTLSCDSNYIVDVIT